MGYEQINMLFVLIAEQRVGNRLGRIEPRAVKRRPEPYPRLMKPRKQAHDEIRMYSHPKKLKQAPFGLGPLILFVFIIAVCYYAAL